MLCQKSGICKKIFSMILRLEMVLSVVSDGRKNIIFYEKNSKLKKSNTFINVSCNRIYPYHFLLIFQK